MIQNISDMELEAKLKALVQNEREILHEILVHIKEVDRRKLYLKKARSSLYDYLVLDYGYSPASAQRRIDAARLMQEIPEVLENIKDGSLNLSQISVFQKAIRQKQKLSKETKITTEFKKDLLLKLKNTSSKETETTISRCLDLPILIKTKVNFQKDDSVRLELTLNAESWKKLKRCQELLGHSVWSGDLAEVIGQISDFYRSKKDPLVQKQVSIQSIKAKSDFTSAGEVSERQKETTKLRRFIFQRAQACQFKDPITGQICGSRFQLEIDHINMVCHGGDNDPSNLRLVCRNHNQWLATEKLGSQHMEKFKNKTEMI